LPRLFMQVNAETASTAAVAAAAAAAVVSVAADTHVHEKVSLSTAE
jgi:hypothetical protein